MYYIESGSTDPYYNLALEQYVFDNLSQTDEFFMLWRNERAIIVGKHQNTVGEINAPYVREHGLRVARRLSGGGAVYHDLGNVNFTFIVNGGTLGSFDFATFCKPVIRALAALGVEAELNGRNDMTIAGKKFSGNAQYAKRGRVMHHGTILYDSDLSVVGQALVVPKDKIESKGLKSVRSRVTNVKSHMREDLPVERFMEELRSAMFREYEMVPYTLTQSDNEGLMTLRETTYATWGWNFGSSPAYSIVKERRVEGCGKLEIRMEVNKGVIQDIAFFGDYFGNGEPADLQNLLTGIRLERSVISEALTGISIEHYFHKLDLDTFLAILTE